MLKHIFTNYVKSILIAIFLICIAVGYIAGFIGYNQFGIHPRTFSLNSIYGVAMSWTMHSDWNHLKNNLLILIQLIIPFVIFENKMHLIKKFWQLVLISGFATWILGGANGVHIGASGLIFALIGYILSTGICTVFNLLRFNKITKENLKLLASNNKYETLKGLIYFGLSCFAISELGYLESILNGLLPQSSDISLSAHFGGLIGGILIGWMNSKTNS